MKTSLLLPMAAWLAGCASMLPTMKQDVSNHWQNFDDAKKSFDQIVPYHTDMDRVRDLGFDPFKTPNLQILNHSQVARAVLPVAQDGIPVPRAILDCLQAQEGCVGYYMEPSRIDRRRVGNFVLDFMNFKRDTLVTGWKFGALIVIIDKTVVYKQWSGHPQIEETEVRRNPLGPFQGAGENMKSLP